MLLNLLRRMTSWELIIYTVDNIEMMILLCGLELLRFGARTHARGILLNTAGRLDHLLNMVRVVLAKAGPETDCTEFADTTETMITAWNDELKETPDFLRSHLMHYEVSIKVGYGVQVIQKRNWNGCNMEGIKQSDKEIKKRLRLVKINEDHSTVFQSPIFNVARGTYNLEYKDVLKMNKLGHPLVPRGKKYALRTLIR